MTQQPVRPGDPFGPIKTPASVSNLPTATEVNRFHSNADTDAQSGGIHHTLGIKHTQAAAGDHTHNGKNSKKLMEGIAITGSKGGNAALASLITKLADALGFTDATS